MSKPKLTKSCSAEEEKKENNVEGSGQGLRKSLGQDGLKESMKTLSGIVCDLAKIQTRHIPMQIRNVTALNS